MEGTDGQVPLLNVRGDSQLADLQCTVQTFVDNMNKAQALLNTALLRALLGDSSRNKIAVYQSTAGTKTNGAYYQSSLVAA